MKTCLFHLNNLTALHVGTGQGVGVVDLPIARSKATNLPIVPGSAIKGVLRDEIFWHLKSHDLYKNITNQDEQEKSIKQVIHTLFGKDKDADHAGAVAFGDANLLILPIRCFSGTVAYVTCAYILKQYQRDIVSDLKTPDNPKDIAQITHDSVLVVQDNTIALEDLDIQSKQSNNAQDWAQFIAKQLYPDGVTNAQEWREEFIKRFVVVPDNIFRFWQILPLRFVRVSVLTVKLALSKKGRYGLKKICLPKVCFGASWGLANLVINTPKCQKNSWHNYYPKKKSILKSVVSRQLVGDFVVY